LSVANIKSNIKSASVRRRYARALFDFCRERGLVDRVAAELEVVAERAERATKARSLLLHPEIPLSAKRVVLEALLPEGLTQETRAFLSLLMERRLLPMLPEIHQAFVALRQESFGLLKAVVETARPLSRESSKRLDDALTAASGRPIVLVEQLNPELIGGVRVHIGDRILDGSIAGRLKQVRDAILRK
jgi:F-type H+-transporting ATPase subunit delta